ncbi:peroxidase, partial [Mycolicibacterium porcinum]
MSELEFDDIQHIMLTGTPHLTGRYEFLSFDTPEAGRAWLAEMVPLVQSATDVREKVNVFKRWVNLAFTWNGLRALGVDEASLASFPDEFPEGRGGGGDRRGGGGGWSGGGGGVGSVTTCPS